MLKMYNCPETEVVTLNTSADIQDGSTDSHGFQDPSQVDANIGEFDEDDDLSVGGNTNFWKD